MGIKITEDHREVKALELASLQAILRAYEACESSHLRTSVNFVSIEDREPRYCNAITVVLRGWTLQLTRLGKGWNSQVRCGSCQSLLIWRKPPKGESQERKQTGGADCPVCYRSWPQAPELFHTRFSDLTWGTETHLAMLESTLAYYSTSDLKATLEAPSLLLYLQRLMLVAADLAYWHGEFSRLSETHPWDEVLGQV